MKHTEPLADALGGWRRRKDFKDVEGFCLFVGYPRSGHSLIGALLNAHPQMVIAHELDAIGLVSGGGYSRRQLYNAIVDRDHWWKKREWKWEGWEYEVEGQSQGSYTDLKVVGDKAGGLTSRQVHKDPGVLEALAQTVKVPVRLIHHVRNPFDTIATMARKGQPGVDSLDLAIDRYFGEHVPGVATAMDWAGHSLLEVRHEPFVEDPGATVRRICRHLGQTAPEPYLAACADRVHPSPKKSRVRVEWTPDQIDRVQDRLGRVSWLDSYSYED